MADRKRKHDRWNTSVKQKSVEAGLSGLFLTCDGHEKQALNETYNLVDRLMEDTESVSKDEHAGKAGDSDSDEDVADSLKRICSEARDGKKEKRCKQRPTGVKNCLFITVRDADVVALAEKMVDLAQASPQCRFLQRVLPVEATADVNLKKLSEMIIECVARHLVAKPDGSLPSYALEFKARNNDSIKKTSVLEMLNDAVNAVAPSARVDLCGADILFYVQVVRKSMMVGGIRKYYGRKKYSMRSTPVAENTSAVSSKKEEGSQEQDPEGTNVQEDSKTDAEATA